MSQRRQTVIGLCVAALGLASPAPATDYALASPYGIRALRVYAVSPSGEITLQGMSSALTQAEAVRVDGGGRFAITTLGPHDLDVWRLTPPGPLSVAASVEVGGSSQRYEGPVAISQDGRIVLALLRDFSLDIYEFRTFVMNNRLEPRATPGRLALTPDLGFSRMGLSDRHPYTALLTLTDQAVAVLSVSPSGEITDTGQRIAVPGIVHIPPDFSSRRRSNPSPSTRPRSSAR